MRQNRLIELERQIERLVDAIVEGTSTSQSNARLVLLEDEKEKLTKGDGILIQEVVPLPNLHQVYRDRVRTLMSSITAPDLRAEVIELIQSMIDSIIVTPLPDGFDIELSGELSTILNIVDQKSKNPGTSVSGRSLSVVAGVGFEPTTFRL